MHDDTEIARMCVGCSSNCHKRTISKAKSIMQCSKFMHTARTINHKVIGQSSEAYQPAIWEGVGSSVFVKSIEQNSAAAKGWVLFFRNILSIPLDHPCTQCAVHDVSCSSDDTKRFSDSYPRKGQCVQLRPF